MRQGSHPHQKYWIRKAPPPQRKTSNLPSHTYCWWKSGSPVNMWVIPLFTGFYILCIPGGAGFLPSTVGHRGRLSTSSLPEASSPLKIDGKGRWSGFLLGCHLFRCELLVSGRVFIYIYYAAWLKEGRIPHQRLLYTFPSARTKGPRRNSALTSDRANFSSSVRSKHCISRSHYLFWSSKSVSRSIPLMSAATVTRSWSSRSWIYPPTISGSWSQRVGSSALKKCISRQWGRWTQICIVRNHIYIYIYICVVFPMWITWFLQSIVHVAKYAQTFPKACFFKKHSNIDLKVIQIFQLIFVVNLGQYTIHWS